MTCRTCKHLFVPNDKAGRRVVRKDNSYECTVKVVMPLLPESVTGACGFKWPPSRSWMSGNQGENCPKWEGLK